jgi:hypothetical protein
MGELAAIDVDKHGDERCQQVTTRRHSSEVTEEELLYARHCSLRAAVEHIRAAIT